MRSRASGRRWRSGWPSRPPSTWSTPGWSPSCPRRRSRVTSSARPSAHRRAGHLRPGRRRGHDHQLRDLDRDEHAALAAEGRGKLGGRPAHRLAIDPDIGALSVIVASCWARFSGFLIEDCIGVKGEVAEDAVPYSRVIVGGSFSIFFLLQLTSIQRALGSSKTPATSWSPATCSTCSWPSSSSSATRGDAAALRWMSGTGQGAPHPQDGPDGRRVGDGARARPGPRPHPLQPRAALQDVRPPKGDRGPTGWTSGRSSISPGLPARSSCSASAR